MAVAGPTGVSSPLLETENTDTVSSPRLVVVSSPPFGLNATEFGSVPVAVAGPTGVSCPLLETENIDTVSSK